MSDVDWHSAAEEIVRGLEAASAGDPKPFYAQPSHPRYAEFAPTGNERARSMMTKLDRLRARLATIAQ